jgi:hypothetical protein
MDFSHNGLYIPVIPVVTVVKTHGIEINAKVTKVGKKAYWALGALPQVLFHELSNSPVQWDPRVAQVISPTKIGEIDVVS